MTGINRQNDQAEWTDTGKSPRSGFVDAARKAGNMLIRAGLKLKDWYCKVSRSYPSLHL